MRRGFSLIELIIVIALIALVGGLVVINAQALLQGLGEEPVERTLQKAVREARFQAASLKEPTSLRYDEETGTLGIFSDVGAELATFATVPEGASETPGIEFEQVLPGEGLEDIRGDTVPIDAVTFRPDRSSTPFEVVIREGRSSFRQRYDPFSAIVIDDSRKD